MESKYIKLLSLCLVILAATAVYYLTKEDYEGGKTRIGKEILVAKDQGRGGEFFSIGLCGSRGVLNDGDNLNDNIGIEFIDFATKERIQISSNPGHKAIGCSPDGRWVLYVDAKTMRYDPSYEYIEGEIGGWMGEVIDLYRYEISTGKRERVAMVRNEMPAKAISPDGKKILLGMKHSFSNKVLVPEWKGVWLPREWDMNDIVWFPDSSGVALRYHVPNKICVAFFGKRSWANCFALAPEIKDNISRLAIDRESRIYFTVFENSDPEYLDKGMDFLYRCSIKDKELFCEKIDEHKDNTYGDIAFLPDGDMVFYNYQENCISRIFSGRGKTRCIIDWVYLKGVSADGRWLAYKRSKAITKLSGEFSRWQYDLYVRELHND
jgi:hypothetical protein